jgi:hypothetical protein
MITTSVCLFGCLFCVPQDKAKVVVFSPAVAAQQIAAAIKVGVAPAVEAVETYGHMADPAVTKAVAKFLWHRDADMKAAGVQSLRFNEDDSALTELLKARKHKDLTRDPVVGAEYYLALGQHGDLKALSTLATNLNPSRRRDNCVRSRVLALGRMRSRTSLKTLIKYASRGGKFRNEVRMSLAALTGLDLGKDAREWAAWWKLKGASYRVGAVEKDLPPRLAKGWQKIWRKPSDEPAQKKKKANAAGDEGNGDSGKGKSDISTAPKKSRKIKFRKKK